MYIYHDNGTVKAVYSNPTNSDVFKAYPVVKANLDVVPGDVIDPETLEILSRYKPTVEEKRKRAKLNRESFMLALKQAGIYGQAMQYAKNLAEDHDWRIRWENSAMFDRTDSDLVAGAKDMGLTDADLDALFSIKK